MDFAAWLLQEEAGLVDAAVLDSYERAFQERLEKLIAQTTDPQLQQVLEDMRHCPIRDRAGHCHSFTYYILGALIRSGCHRRVDVEDALQYVIFRMLSSVGERGQPRRSLFHLEDRPPTPGTNPLQGRFLAFLRHDLATICGGRVPRVARVQRPSGTLTISPDPDEPGTVSPEAIPARVNRDELFADILELLRQRSSPEFPLTDLFLSLIAGDSTRTLHARFGRAATDHGREVIRNVIEDYAQRTGNVALLSLLSRLQEAQPTPPEALPPKLPTKVKDYRSILDVIERAGGAVTMDVLGRKRSRWLGRPPRDPDSPHKTRLHDVLAAMVDDKVLRKVGPRYHLGPRAYEYQQPLAVSGSDRYQ